MDTDEPRRLADFYAALLDWEVARDDGDWVEIHPTASPAGTSSAGGAASGPGIAFQLAPDYTPPTWPAEGVPQQFHLDLDVPDLDEGERFALSLGARLAPATEHESSFRVFLDLSGHPFCLCLDNG